MTGILQSAKEMILGSGADESQSLPNTNAKVNNHQNNEDPTVNQHRIAEVKEKNIKADSKGNEDKVLYDGDVPVNQQSDHFPHLPQIHSSVGTATGLSVGPEGALSAARQKAHDACEKVGYSAERIRPMATNSNTQGD